MKNKAFSLVEMVIVLAITGFICLAIPNLFNSKKEMVKRPPQIDYDCYILEGIQECAIYVDGELDSTCEFSELSAIIKEKKKRR